MKFYNRKNELETLENIFNQCKTSYGKITVLTGVFYIKPFQADTIYEILID